MKQAYKNILFCNKGFSILGTMLAFTFLGISGAGLLHFTSNVQKTSQSTAQKVELKPLLKQQIINNLKSLLIEKSINEHGKAGTANIYGVCSLVQPPSVSSGVAQLKLDLRNIHTKDNSTFSTKRWKFFFPKTQWEFVEQSPCKRIDSAFKEDKLNHCLRYKGEGTLQNTIYAIARITPRALPGMNVISTTENNAVIDPKKVVFHLETQLMSADSLEEESSIAYISSLSGIVWANETGECHATAPDGQRTIVKFSGTGTGTTFSRSVFNNPLYSPPPCSGLKIGSLSPDIAQVGNIDNLRLLTLTGLNAKISCTRNTFKCKQKIQSATTLSGYDNLQFTFHTTKILNKIPVKAINFTLQKADGKEWDGDDNGVLDGATVALSPDSTTLISGNKPIKLEDITAGNFSAVVSGSKVASACHSICKNYKPKDQSTYIYPAISIHEDKTKGCVFQSTYSADTGSHVRCTVCHTKACHRFGLGTFGPFKTEQRDITTVNQPASQQTIYGLGEEPLDGQLPECTVKHSYSAMRKPPTLPDSGNANVSGNTCKGITMNITDENSFKNFNSNTYKARNCNKKLPVLCFVNGHYMPAVKLNPNNLNAPVQVVQTSFHNTQTACFEMGREIGKLYDLGILLYSTYSEDKGNRIQKAISAVTALPPLNGNAGGFNLESPSDTKFNFINNAGRGMFLAPPAGYKVEFLPEKIKTIISAVLSLGKTEIWTAYEWDGGGAPMASPPWALVAKDHPFSLYYSKEDVSPRPVILLRNINTPFNLNKKPLALTHSVRYKGLVPRAHTENLRFVCKNHNTGKFFISSGKGAQNNGQTVCKNEKGAFLPPESGLDYAKLMMDLNPNDDEYPFPDPKVLRSQIVSSTPPSTLTASPTLPTFLHSKSIPNPSAWVALQLTTPVDKKNSSPPRKLKDMRLGGYFNQSSPFLTLDKDTIVKNFLYNHYINVQGIGTKLKDPGCKSSKKSISDFKKICIDNKHLPKSLVGLNDSCPDGTTALNLQKGRHKKTFAPAGIKYMSKWVSAVYGDNIVLHSFSAIPNKVNEWNIEVDRKKNSECKYPRPAK